MYRKPSLQKTIDDFILPFSGKLSAENRWVQLAQMIPWDEIEEEYAFMFPSDRGNVAKPVRMALGSLIIQARCGFTDRPDCAADYRESLSAIFHRPEGVPADETVHAGGLGQVSQTV